MQYLHAGSYVVASTWTKSSRPLSDYHTPMSLMSHLTRVLTVIVFVLSEVIN